MGVSVFGKDNAGKSKGDDLESTSADKDGVTKVDKRTKADDVSTKTNANVGADSLGI